MGYTTYFSGQINIKPKLTPAEVRFLQSFNQGEYSLIHPKDLMGSDYSHCQWTPDPKGHFLEWDEGEKFYHAELWMVYLIEYFLKHDPIMKIQQPHKFDFLIGHTLNGVIEAEGEEHPDYWKIVVRDNVVTRAEGYIDYGEPTLFVSSDLQMKLCFLSLKPGSDKCDSCKVRFDCYTQVQSQL